MTEPVGFEPTRRVSEPATASVSYMCYSTHLPHKLTRLEPALAVCDFGVSLNSQVLFKTPAAMETAAGSAVTGSERALSTRS